MADLYILLHGRSKKKMKPIMIDDKKKCENYRDARRAVAGWHSIESAPKGSVQWRQKSATIGGNKDISGPAIHNRHGVRKVNGYISKNGFQPHT